MTRFEATVALAGGELIALYLMLKRDENTLDRAAESVLFKIEKILYERLTIGEIEEIQRSGNPWVGRDEGD